MANIILSLTEQEKKVPQTMSETVAFVPDDFGGYEMWKYSKSPYPIYLGSISGDGLDEETNKQESLGFNVWVQ